MPHTGSAVAGSGRGDPANLVAEVVAEKRELLLRSYRCWLPREDLEDCLGQATVELLLRARRAEHAFENTAHVRHALEQKLRSRICDRLRARSGRSAGAAALARASSLDEITSMPDLRCDTEASAAAQLELDRALELARDLSADQRLALLHDVFLDTDPAEFRARYGWTEDKRRKVLQRARRRLRDLLAEAA